MPTSPPNPPGPKLWQQQFRLPWLQSFLETLPLSRAPAGSIRSRGGMGGVSQLARRQKGSREQGPKPAPWYNATQRLKGVRKNRTRGKKTEEEEAKGAQRTFGTTKTFFTTLRYGHTHTQYTQYHPPNTNTPLHPHSPTPTLHELKCLMHYSDFFCFLCLFFFCPTLTCWVQQEHTALL